MLFLFVHFLSQAQDVGEPEMQRVTIREWELEVFLNTSGGGIGFQQGWTPDYFNKHFWEINFLYNQHPKAIRGRNTSLPEATTYSYGKLCDLFFLRAGYGYQRTLNHKPYWGGVQVRFTFSGGFCLGMGLPVYLNILVPNSLGGATIETERYDTAKHNIGNIVGRAGFFRGIGKTALRPGAYAKTGLHFDFSKDNLVTHAIEIGASVDIVFPPIQQMAFNKAKPFYLCAYIAYHFGKKKGHYE